MFPCFRSVFLNHCCQAFTARNKALSHRGCFTYHSDPEDSFEWLTINYQPLVGPYVIFQIIEDHRVNLFLRSNRKHNRGKVLLAMENLTVVRNPSLLVEAFERTLDL